jgi:hypothetical protein
MPITAQSIMSGWFSSTPSNSGGATWKPRTLIISLFLFVSSGLRGYTYNQNSYLFPINDIPFLTLSITVYDVSGLKVTFAVPRFGVGLGVVEVSLNHRRSSNAKFTSNVVVGYILPVIVNQSENLVNFFRAAQIGKVNGTHLISVLGINVLPTLPVSSSSG